MKPLAIIPAYNEADIIDSVVEHLLSQGCDVHLIDNWSTDATTNRAVAAGALFASDGTVGISGERWPAARSDFYDWTGLLQRVEEIAARFPGRWCMLHDADEIRRAPECMVDHSLAAALEFAGERGANAVSFHVQTYAPVNDDWDRLHSLPPLSPNGPEDVFRYLLPEHVDHGLPHVKAWLQPDGERVDLHTSGGHHVVFNNARVKLFPLPFLLKHYPIRSQAHGERKVLVERLPRYLPAERKKNWHVQYDWAWSFRGQPSLPAFTRRPVELLPDSNTAIVTLTRFPDIFERFAASVERHEPVRRRIVVTSGGCKIERLGWEVIEDLEPEFNFARNANIGIARAGGADVVLVNDDVELVQPIIDELQWSAHNSGADIVTPQIIGDGINNRWAQASLPLVGRCMVLLAPEYIPFVCVLLRREMIRDVGLLDEGFAGYGGEDEEYCDRARKVGAELAVSAAQVRHGFGGLTYSSSFFRVMTPAERDATMRQNRLRAATLAGDERPPEQADSDPRGRGEPGETQT